MYFTSRRRSSLMTQAFVVASTSLNFILNSSPVQYSSSQVAQAQNVMLSMLSLWTTKMFIKPGLDQKATEKVA